ncbi:uncharacterized protein LOC114293648 [Camellia sinensis]|uniref:uncharacterized protein LOC114293648 n=1 Tax=Camellia sinensis TaxID=4442 RepID=UPI001036CD32|nr:uncharacterized protein LOC114293648 [Camellia sinensis]
MDYKKAQKFEGGLRGAILDRVNMLKLPTYVDVLERVVIEEGNIATQNRIFEWKGKRQNTQWPKGSIIPPNKKQNSWTSNTSTRSQDSIPVCSECGMKHRGTCYRKSGACFQCGKTGHLIWDCHQRRQQQNGNRAATSSARSTPTPNTKTATKPTNNKDTARQGRVFALVSGDVQNAATTVSGTFIVHGHSAHVLFDSSSTHSFVSKLFAPNLDETKEKLSYMLYVSSPLGESMICATIYLACELQLGDSQVYANLLPLDMTYFDIVLGMDWLNEYGAIIHCLTKQISFHPLGQSKSTFQGQEVTSPPYLISTAKAFVREFPDVFPEELPGQLLDREIEFIIKVVPGTQPISKTLYRVSPVKMKELTVQL